MPQSTWTGCGSIYWDGKCIHTVAYGVVAWMPPLLLTGKQCWWLLPPSKSSVFKIWSYLCAKGATGDCWSALWHLQASGPQLWLQTSLRWSGWWERGGTHCQLQWPVTQRCPELATSCRSCRANASSRVWWAVLSQTGAPVGVCRRWSSTQSQKTDASPLRKEYCQSLNVRGPAPLCHLSL